MDGESLNGSAALSPKQLSSSSSNHSSHRDPLANKSPALASLEWLQTQRRGSITDPSLHAAPTSSTIKLNTAYRQQPEQPNSASSGSSSAHYEPSLKGHMSDPRPSSPYVFGDATLQTVDHSSQLRKLLHSPASEQNTHRPPSALSHESQEPPRHISAPSNSKETNHMDVDHERHDPLNRRNREYFDFNMRRHSIAVGQNPITLPHISSSIPHGTKRKMSVDRGIFAPVTEDIDPQLVGPGVPSAMSNDTDAPAPKRRGSTIDTHRIAQLSLEDRRNSVDARGGSWFLNERRDSAPNIFSSVPSMTPFNQPFHSNDPPQARVPHSMASFSWPINPGDQPNGNHNGDTDMNRTFDSTNHLGMIPPPMNFPPDRRMSVPDTLTNPVPTRVLRSRSRSPSRQNTANSLSAASSGQEESGNAPGSANAANKLSKEGTTPYSRSPELRVSHKLAERKRRKEMKELFDDLRDQLPADRGMKASKWEILTKAIEFVNHLKENHQVMAQEIEALRREVETLRQGGMQSYPPNGPPHPVVYGQIPPMSTQFPHGPGGPMQQQTVPTPPGPHHHVNSSVSHAVSHNGHRPDTAPPPSSS